ncbi:uncharacterized protein ACBR49_019288 [Aulostomus maculatus]
MHVMGSVSPANQSETPHKQKMGVTVLTCPLDNQTVLPPTPPPLPPPPPPLLLGQRDPAGGLRRKKRVRSFFWKTIPEEQVKGRANLWTQGSVQQKYQIDIHTIEELFGQGNSQSTAKATPSRGGKARSSFREARDEVTILDAKKGMNIGIFLKQFKRSNQTIVQDIRCGNSEPYGAEPLRDLLKLLPEMKEFLLLQLRNLKAYGGEVSRLSLADSFIYLLIQLSSYTVRIEAMLLKEEFPGTSETMRGDIETLRLATREVMSCKELHAVLHLVLQAGNILNAGGYAGNAVGFKLSSLLAIADTKANKPGMNLLHFVALEAQKKDATLLDFPLKMSHVQAASRISLEGLDGELQRLTSHIHSVGESIQRDTELLQQLDNFLQHATTSLCSLHDGRQQLQSEGSKLMEFLCEDRETFKLDDCFSIFYTFCCRFTNAVKENEEQGAKEVARQRRLQVIEEQKRHSWAGGEEVGRAVGQRCSSETDMVGAISCHENVGMLMELLTPKFQSPLISNPPGNARSLRRSRNCPSSSPSIAADRELNMLLGMASLEGKVSLLRGAGEAKTAFLSASPEPQSNTNHQNQLPPHSPPPLAKANVEHTTATYLSNKASPVNSIDHLAIRPTSDMNQQSDHSNYGKDQWRSGSSVQTASDCPSGSRGKTSAGQDSINDKPAAIAVVLEKCMLVPELKGFNKITTGNRAREGGLPGNHQEDMTQIQEAEYNPKKDDNVVVWCMMGMCDAAGEQTHTDVTQTENHECDSQSSSAPPNLPLPEPQPANKKPVPISSQPVPVFHRETSPHKVSSTRLQSQGPSLSTQTPTAATDATEDTREPANQGVEPDGSTNQKSEEETCKSVDKRTSASSHLTWEAEPATSSKTSHKNIATSKTRPSGIKPTANKSKPVRMLTSSESECIRRVVPISRTMQMASIHKHSEKVPGHHQVSLNSLTAGTANNSSLLRGDRPLAAPSSQHSSVHDGPKLPGSRELDRKPCIRKPVAKAEEKICRSTLRALGPTEGTVARSGINAPTMPSHKATPPSSCPGFARSTASSSFRRTHTSLVSPSSPKTSFSTPLPSTSSPLSRVASLKLTDTYRSADQTSPAIPLRRTLSIRAPPRSLLHKSLVPPRGHKPIESCVSDKSVNCQDSPKSTRPSWR